MSGLHALKHCSGSDEPGTICQCLRMAPKPLQKIDEPKTCFNCGHWDTCHPTTTFSVSQLVNSYKDTTLGGSAVGLKASMEAATNETNAGLRRNLAMSASSSKDTKGKGKVL